MARVRVSVPATINNFGPGIESIALAVRLYHTVELAELDAGFQVDADSTSDPDETRRITAALLSTIRAMSHRMGCTPTGLRAASHQGELASRGLGLDDGLALGCAIALNALAGGILSRDEIASVVLGIGARPAPTIASLKGNMAIALGEGPTAIHTLVSPAPLEVILLLPDMAGDDIEPPEEAPDSATLALLADALRTGNHALLGDLSKRTLQNRELHKGWDAAVQTAGEMGASGVFIHAGLHSAAAFAKTRHAQIAQAMAEAYEVASGSAAQVRVVPVETHGISIDAIDIIADAAHPPAAASRLPA